MYRHQFTVSQQGQLSFEYLDRLEVDSPIDPFLNSVLDLDLHATRAALPCLVVGACKYRKGIALLDLLFVCVTDGQ